MAYEKKKLISIDYFEDDQDNSIWLGKKEVSEVGADVAIRIDLRCKSSNEDRLKSSSISNLFPTRRMVNRDNRVHIASEKCKLFLILFTKKYL